MRAFTNLSALPGHTIVIDGEVYDCPGFKPDDIQGSVRKVPADRILAVQWHGDHGHGSVEGYGAMEGFTDRSQLAPYVKAWLVARAKAKSDRVAALVRQQGHIDEMVASNEAAAAGLRSDIAAATDKDRIAMTKKMLDRVTAETTKIKGSRPTDAQVTAAKAEAAAAQKEADDA